MTQIQQVGEQRSLKKELLENTSCYMSYLLMPYLPILTAQKVNTPPPSSQQLPGEGGGSLIFWVLEFCSKRKEAC